MERHEIEAAAKVMIDQLKAIFLLAGIEIKSFHQLPNGYCGDNCCRHRPWMLAETKYGLIKIGWRKRVINIDWTGAKDPVHGKDVLEKGDESVTNWETGVHAWGYSKAIDCLSKFAQISERIIYNREADARLSTDEVAEYNTLSKRYSEEKVNFPSLDYDRLKVLAQKRQPPRKQG